MSVSECMKKEKLEAVEEARVVAFSGISIPGMFFV